MRYKRNSFLIEGKKNVVEALKTGQKISNIYFSDEIDNKYIDKIDQLINNSISLEKVTAENISETSTLVNPEGVLAIGKIDEQKKVKALKQDKYLFLYRIKDPGNLGTILRTAAWFDIKNILLSSGSVDPYNPKVVRASMGGLFYTSIITDVDFQELKEVSKQENIKILSADMSGKRISKIKNPPEYFILCMGNESHGLSNEIVNSSDLIVSIPKLGQGESLNLAISAGIIIKDLVIP